MPKLLMATTISATLQGFLLPYAKYFRSLGWTVDALSQDTTKNQECINAFDDVYDVPWSRNPLDLRNLFTSPAKIREIVQRGGYDIVHVHTPVAAFVARFALRKLRAAGKVKVIYTAHGFHFYKGGPKIKNGLFITLEKLAGRWTDHLVVINQEDYEAALKYKIATKEHLTLMPGIGISLEKFIPIDSEKKHLLRQKFQFRDHDFLLIFTGELNSNKNQIFLINAMSRIVQDIPNAILLLAGEGKMRYALEKLIQEKGLESHVKLLGLRTDIPEIAAMCDIGVSSSIREGLGLNVLEYLSCGLPVVVSNNRGHKEMVINGENGYLYKLNNENEYVSMITKLYQNKDLYYQASHNAPISINKFALERTIPITEKIYKYYMI